MTTISTCPELQELAQFVLHQLSSKEAKTITEHMFECDQCLATVGSLESGTSPGGRRLPAEVAPAQSALELVQPSLDEVKGQVQPSRLVASHRNPQRAMPAELPAKSSSPTWLVIGFALVAALSFVCFSYGSDIARFFQRTISSSHVE